jgi:hypothetical protein
LELFVSYYMMENEEAILERIEGMPLPFSLPGLASPIVFKKGFPRLFEKVFVVCARKS